MVALNQRGKRTTDRSTVFETFVRGALVYNMNLQPGRTTCAMCSPRSMTTSSRRFASLRGRAWPKISPLPAKSGLAHTSRQLQSTVLFRDLEVEAHNSRLRRCHCPSPLQITVKSSDSLYYPVGARRLEYILRTDAVGLFRSNCKMVNRSVLPAAYEL